MSERETTESYQAGGESVAERNLERLLKAAYRPEAPSEDFARRLHAAAQQRAARRAGCQPAPQGARVRWGSVVGWSVAAAAVPEIGESLMEKWFANGDRDVRRIMKENLTKNRLVKMDAAWVKRWQLELR